MLAKIHRFHGYGSLQFLFKKGYGARAYCLTIRAVENPRRKSFRAAVVVSKKVAKSAVERNRIRRRIFEQVRAHEAGIAPNHDFAIIVHDSVISTMPAPDLAKLIDQLLRKAKLLAEKPAA